MPLFTRELNQLADYIGRADLTIWLHTAAPSDASPTNGRITAGGGTFESGAMLTEANISAASGGDISNAAAIAYGTADEDVGTVTHWAAFRGQDPVAFGTVPPTTVNNGDSFTIPVGALQFNGATS